MVVKSVLTQAIQELGVAGDFTDYSSADVDGVIAYAQDAIEVEKFEGGNFSLFKKDNYYFLKKHDTLVGWVLLNDTAYNGQQYHAVEIIYVLPKFRQTKATLLLVYGLKEILPNPVIVDGVLFKKGKELLTGIYDRDRFKISTVDKHTGEKTPFNPTDLTIDASKNFVIVESTRVGFYGLGWLPGQPTRRTYFALFEHLHDIEL